MSAAWIVKTWQQEKNDGEIYTLYFLLQQTLQIELREKINVCWWWFLILVGVLMVEPLLPSKLETFLLVVTALYPQGYMDKIRPPPQSHEQSWHHTVCWIGALQSYLILTRRRNICVSWDFKNYECWGREKAHKNEAAPHFLCLLKTGPLAMKVPSWQIFGCGTSNGWIAGRVHG